MSASSSPRIAPAHVEQLKGKKRERPPALELVPPEGHSSPDSGPIVQPRVQINIPAELAPESERDGPRSTSAASSSLDPYYFTARTPADSPLPPMPPPPLPAMLPRTPDAVVAPMVPITPARNPADIDRRGLVGVGELTTPRWIRTTHRPETEDEDRQDTIKEEEREDFELITRDDVGEENAEDDDAERDGSPWTIEAVDEARDDFKDELIEPSQEEPPPARRTAPRVIRPSRSMASESGGEEILYPRKPHMDPYNQPKLPERRVRESPSATPSDPVVTVERRTSALGSQRSRRKASEDMDTDSSSAVARRNGAPVSTPIKDKIREERDSARKHRSLGASVSTTPSSREKARETRRESAAPLAPSSSVRAPVSKHSRSSSTSSHGGDKTHSKRATGTDFAHLPPSPSSAAIQQFLRNPAPPAHASHNPGPSLGSTSAVAHSLLRGTQEGWSDLDDAATAETLRKLDGISGKASHARSRTSTGSRPTSMSRPSSRPGTPGGARGAQWEGIEGRSSRSSKKSQARDSLAAPARDKGGESEPSPRLEPPLALEDPSTDPGEELHVTFSPEKLPPKKRSSVVTPKRGSAGSTTYTGTPTTSSRDSGNISAATSLTSVSATSGRQSANKARRNSAGSDMSAHSSDVASLRDRAAALALSGEHQETEQVPPVPPLPKNLSNLRSPPHSASTLTFPTSASKGEESDPDRTVSMDLHAPVFSSPSKGKTKVSSPPAQRVSTQESSSSHATPLAPRTPSKKWSISSALNLNMKLSSPRSAASNRSPVVTSPLSNNFPTKSAELQPKSSGASQYSVSEGWVQPAAMASAASLASLSSVGSTRDSPSSSFVQAALTTSTPEQTAPSRPETASSHSTNQALSTGLAPSQGPLSPSSSLHRGSSKRLTPSSIPFFRRSSSQSMQVPPGAAPKSASPPPKTSARLRVKSTMSPPTDSSLSSPATPGSASAKKSMLSLGLPSLLRGSASRKSLHSDREKESARSDKEAQREAQRAAREAEKSRERAEKERRKEERDRSESRISVLMGRKRGKTMSEAAKKDKSPTAALPPMQMSAIPPSTAQRVASLKSSTSTPTSSSRVTASSSRLTSQTISSLHKQSDASLRSSRGQLPTIAGSPSVGTTSRQSSVRDNSMPPPSTLGASTSSSLTKETPTKIPRITGTGRSSATASPSTLTQRRQSVHAHALSSSTGAHDATPSPSLTATNENAMDEFGMLENNENQPPPPAKTMPSTPSHRLSVRASPSTSTSSRVPRQVSNPTTASTRKNRESISFSGIRKASNGSVASLSTGAPAPTQAETTMQRLAALSPSRGLKLLSPKISLATSRTFQNSNSTSSGSGQVSAVASSSRQSLNTPSPAPSSVDDEEAQGDEEMLHYIRRQQAKKLASGATQEELDDMMRFPEPLPPVAASSPAAVLKSSQAKYLSEYERKEILDFDSVYFFGQRSQKKNATLDNSTNNYGYDDDRGDYLIVNHDHLAYRYEVVGSLGKGSFGQVLRCRDHCTGEFVAIKIIRNKKRFHHQALVEIKILDNLRKWDPDDKHQVIKMTEHFTFRGHLCIAMELLSINLYELIKANSFVGFSTSLIRRFTNQMLLSLALMRQHRIVHCDLKPENVLLKHPAKSGIKVIDFGSSCLEHEKIYTYIQSRFYRSPEVILGMNYHMAIDMWSLGCIMAELYTGFPIFPGENEQEQLSCIMEVLGVPDKDFINRSSRKKLFFDPSGVARPVVNSKGRRRRPGTKTLAQVLRCDDELFVDFIAKCLTWDPERRLKPQQALRHPFILGGRRSKIATPAPTSSKSIASSLSSSSRSKVGETPKKSQISAPTPLTARISRTNSGNVTSTPNGSVSAHTLGSTSRSYRASQSQTFSSYHSSRTMTGFAGEQAAK